MAKYHLTPNNSIEFKMFEPQTSASVTSGVSFSQSESVGITTKGKRLKKENISEEVVNLFYKFFNEHKEALRSLT